MKAHKIEHKIRGSREVKYFICYDFRNLMQRLYPRWTEDTGLAVGLNSRNWLIGCITGPTRYADKGQTDTYPKY